MTLIFVIAGWFSADNKTLSERIQGADKKIAEFLTESHNLSTTQKQKFQTKDP